jgi:hypothetical protein
VETAGAEVAASTGEEAAFTLVAEAFTAADFADVGSAFSGHTATVVMVATTRVAAI